MSRNLILTLLIIYYSLGIKAQQDSIVLEELAITATRSEKKISSIPMPVSLIKSSQIKGPGLIRLQDVLSEQTGLRIVPQINGLGSGIQVQGLNPDYTLVLLDGEPIIGRYTGTLDLNRITSHNIHRIEIVKGPSSSLYGSDALAGVVHIITDQAWTNKLNVGSRYSSRNTLDLNSQGTYVFSKLRINASVNRFSTNGYDLTPEVYGQTVAPYKNYTFGLKLFYNPTKNDEIKFSFRTFNENQTNQFQVISGNDSIKVNGDGIVSDYNGYTSYKRRFNSKWNLQLSQYFTQYNTSTQLFELGDTQKDFYSDRFLQQFIRPELILSYNVSKNSNFLFGSGFIHEAVKSSRYGDEEKKIQSNYYSFGQYEFNNIHWDISIGARLDKNTSYSAQFSPKFAAQYKINNNNNIKISTGRGFKAPDFRQLYLNFRNDAASYSVFGTEVINQQLRLLQQSGQLSEVYIPLDKSLKISAESSWAINLGSHHQLTDKAQLDVNIFRNDLSDLIETMIVATSIQQKNIYSYRNLHRVFTQGIELNANYNLNSNIKLSLGYQYLEAKDKDVLDRIDKGLVYGRDPKTLQTYQVKKSDYFGLAGRSKHQFNFKIQYSLSKYGLEFNLRLFYYSKSGVNSLNGNVSGISIPNGDINGNSIVDRNDRYVSGYFIMNINLSKKLGGHFTTQLGAENLFNYKDPVFIPNLIGRNIFISLQYNFFKS